MAKVLVRLIDLLETPEVYGDITTNYIDYEPDGKVINVKLDSDETGCKKIQTPCIEQLNWNLFTFNDSSYAISEPTMFYLKLSGKTGIKNAYKIMEKYNRMYANLRLGTTADVLTEEMFKQLPSHLKNAQNEYWLSSSYEEKNNVQKYFGLRSVIDSKANNRFVLFIEGGGTYYGLAAVRVVVKFQRDILVNFDTETKKVEFPEKFY